MNRRSIREHIFKLLFHIEFNSRDEMESQIAHFYEDEANAATDGEIAEIKTKLYRILDNLDLIDRQLSEKMTKWSIDRVARIDLTILRLAVYEIQLDDEVDTSVAINEAVELAKKYGQKESSGFVNGVLAKFAD